MTTTEKPAKESADYLSAAVDELAYELSDAQTDELLIVAAHLLADDIRKVVRVWIHSDKLTPKQKRDVMDATCTALCEALTAATG
jgi:hypothetical protein